MPMKFFAAIAFALTMAAGTAAAQSAPAGSYQKTCTNIQMSGETLSATCKTMSGSTNQTTLQYPTSCVGDIGNVNGILACAGPNGSYSLTCSNITVSGSTLNATCKQKNGNPVAASLANFQGFQGNISNCDGKLQNGPC